MRAVFRGLFFIESVTAIIAGHSRESLVQAFILVRQLTPPLSKLLSTSEFDFLADRTIGRAFATGCRLSVCLSVVCRL